MHNIVAERRPYKDLTDYELYMKALVYRSMADGSFSKMIDLVETVSKIPGAKQACEAVLKKTALRLFFGGASFDKAEKKCKDILKKGWGVIIDFSAPENNKRPTDKTFDAVKDKYENTILLAQVLSQKLNNPHNCESSIAIKVSTLGASGTIEKISEKISKGEELSEAERNDYNKIKNRVTSILQTAKDEGITVYVDAEETKKNPFIKQICKDSLDAGYNLNVTIQAYLQNCYTEVKDWIDFSNTHNISDRLGVKLVRGAYLDIEKDKYGENKYIWGEGKDHGKALTDKAYNDSFKELYESGEFAMITVATHNDESLLKAASVVHFLKDQIKTKTCSATLLGMGDYLETGGMDKSKYVPITIGDISGAVAYSGRRAKEFLKSKNVEGLSRGEEELKWVIQELRHRKSIKAEKVASSMTIENLAYELANSFGLNRARHWAVKA